MTSKNIFNAIRNIDEKLILDASPSENKLSAKKKILLKVLTSVAAVILVISLSIGGVMMRRDGVEAPEDADKDLGEPSKDNILSVDHSEYFSSLDEFKSYINDKEQQSKHCPIDDGVYVDFSSILPDSEIKEITAYFHNWYDVRYAVKDDSIPYGLSIDFITTPTREKYDYNVEEMIKSGALSETPLKSISEIEDYKATTSYTRVEIGEYTLFYYTYLYSNPDQFDNFVVFINDYRIDINWNDKLSIDDYTPEQSEFLSAIVPEYGATDGSVIAMLDKIKALIPESDEADNTQENDSADKNGTVTSNDSGSTTNQTVSEPSYGGETGDETYYEEEEYLFPEDYEFPVIPGISPDWKPNRNGKYPYKNGYTRYELTLILACEIMIDFGDMTDEEISKLEFRLIEEEAEE